MPGTDLLSSALRPPLSADRVHRVVARHFDPRGGSPFWLEREAALGIDARRDIREAEDLDALGFLDQQALRERSVWDFVPRSLQEDLSRFVLAETGGTLGEPKRTAYVREDFEAAFIAPFLAAVEGRLPLNGRARWAWIGPGGPHVIGKAAREVCRALGAPDPFAVDFDPRWYKAQVPGSLGRRRYLEHVLDQAVAIFRREPIEALFVTPPVAAELGTLLPEETRRRVAFVHLGGLAWDDETAARMRRGFPRAVFLSGYGNSLLGMCPQLDFDELAAPRYYPHGGRLWIRLVARDARPAGGPVEQVPYGERGRVLSCRLDESFLIVNLLERDSAARLPPRLEEAERGFLHDGLGDPRPLEEVPADRVGIY